MKVNVLDRQREAQAALLICESQKKEKKKQNKQAHIPRAAVNISTPYIRNDKRARYPGYTPKNGHNYSQRALALWRFKCETYIYIFFFSTKHAANHLLHLFIYLFNTKKVLSD